MITTGTLGVVALDGLEDIDPVHVAVLEPDIQDHQVTGWSASLNSSIAFVGMLTASRVLYPSSFENIRDQFPDVPFIIDDQNVSS